MALPITAQPVSTVYGGAFGKGRFYVRRNRYKQARPYDLPLPYTIRQTYCIGASGTGIYSDITKDPYFDCASTEILGFRVGPNSDLQYNNEINQAANKAYGRLVSMVKEEAMLAVNYAERKQAYAMITSRAITLARFALSLKRGSIKRAARILKVLKPAHLPDKIRPALRNVANLWLEFHFGWEPMIKDIYAAVDIIQSGPASGTIEARGRVRFEMRKDSVSMTGGGRRSFSTGYAFSTVGVSYTVSNPNLFKANELGLINPVSVIWELVPFSFVVDWFTNVGAVISSFTDWIGITLKDPFHLKGLRIASCQGYLWYTYGGVTSRKYSDTTFLYAQRLNGLPSVNLHWDTMGFRNSPTRAFTAITLLLQGLQPAVKRAH